MVAITAAHKLFNQVRAGQLLMFKRYQLTVEIPDGICDLANTYSYWLNIIDIINIIRSSHTNPQNAMGATEKQNPAEA